jgi:hypothetical protein
MEVEEYARAGLFAEIRNAILMRIATALRPHFQRIARDAAVERVISEAYESADVC